MDYVLISQQLLRACRGRRSQAVLSQRLGFRSNQLYRWEAGLRGIGWRDFVAVCAACRMSLGGQLKSVLGYSGDPVNTARLLDFLLGDMPTRVAAEKLDCSYQSLGRYRRGAGDPKMSLLLQIVDQLQGRLVEFIEGIAGPGRIEALVEKQQQRDQEKALRIAFPICNVVCSLLETQALRNTPYRRGMISEAVGISLADEEQLLRALQEVGAIERKGNRYSTTEKGLELNPADVATSLRQRLYWARFPPSLLERSRAISEDSLFGWAVFAVSDDAFGKIREKLREAYGQIVAIANADAGAKSAVKIMNINCLDFAEYRASGAKLPIAELLAK